MQYQKAISTFQSSWDAPSQNWVSKNISMPATNIKMEITPSMYRRLLAGIATVHLLVSTR